MKKTSIYLDDELDRALALRAADEGLSKAELIRRSLAASISRPTRPKPAVGVFRSGRSGRSGLGASVDDRLNRTGFGG